MSAIPTISITEANLLTQMKNWLIAVSGLGTNAVVKGQANRVAMPNGNYVLMTSLGMKELSYTKKATYTPGSANPGTEGDERSMEWRVQLDCYGPGAFDLADTLKVITRTEFTFDQFAASGVDMQPLYASEPRNLTIVNGEGQYEPRWSFDLHVQYNPVVTFQQSFADALEVTPKSIDAQFPPESSP